MGDVALMPLLWEVEPVLVAKGVRGVQMSNTYNIFEWDKDPMRYSDGTPLQLNKSHQATACGPSAAALVARSWGQDPVRRQRLVAGDQIVRFCASTVGT
jgi:hypothetical protein